jgi:hypothetical protein
MAELTAEPNSTGGENKTKNHTKATILSNTDLVSKKSSNDIKN